MRDILSNLKFHIGEDLIKEVIAISLEAGNAIMTVYETDFEIQIKDDYSPVTEADKKANIIIEKGLKEIDNTIPILSEEGKHIIYEDRNKWNRFLVN